MLVPYRLQLSPSSTQTLAQTPAHPLQGARQYILRATSVRPAVRLALLQRGSTDALLFELPRGAGASAARPSPLGAAAGASAPLASVRGAPDERMPVTVSSMSLAGTLLGSAISERQARFVKDCSRYMQVRAPARRGGRCSLAPARARAPRTPATLSPLRRLAQPGRPGVRQRAAGGRASAPCWQPHNPIISSLPHTWRAQSCPKMARDVFGRNSELVSSVVVVPLVVDGAPIGGLYFALDSPCSFEGMQDALLVGGG